MPAGERSKFGFSPPGVVLCTDMNISAKSILSLFLLLSAFGWLAGEEPAASAPATFKGVINADKLNVRVKPGLGRSVVAILAQGDTVDARSLRGDWVEIAAPKSTAVWVASSFVVDGSLKNGAPLRAGPGVAYETFGVVATP